MNKTLAKMTVELDSNEWHAHPSESVWVERISDDGTHALFKVMNSPFFSRNISFCDIVRARNSKDGSELIFEEVVLPGGHSTYMIIRPANEERFEQYWEPLRKIGCTFECGKMPTSDGEIVFYSVDVPPSTDVNKAFEFLDNGEKDGVWMFQEGRFNHRPTPRH